MLAGLAGGAHAGLGGEEEVLPVPGHPRPDTQLGVAVARGGVDVIDPVLEQQIQRAVGLILGGARERGRAEEGGGAEMPRASERSSLDHADASFGLNGWRAQRLAGQRPVARNSSKMRAGVTGGRSTSTPYSAS